MDIICRPGYLGKKREETYDVWNSTYGVGKWALRWKVNECYYDFLGVCALYEDAYFEYLKNDSASIIELTEAGNVYDDSPSNVDSGLNYLTQETNRTHIQDIAIRRCLVRLGYWFTGSNLLQIRDKIGKTHISIVLSPGNVPFHRPEWIEQPILEGWWQPNSVECFYQSNKFLVKLDELPPSKTL